MPALAAQAFELVAQRIRLLGRRGVEDAANLGERHVRPTEQQRLLQPADVVGPVVAVAVLPPGRMQQPLFLVVVQRPHAHIGDACELVRRVAHLAQLPSLVALHNTLHCHAA